MSKGVSRTIVAAGFGLALSLVTAAGAVAQPTPAGYAYTPPVRAHDGFFARVHIGPGYTQLSTAQGDDGLSISGSGGAFSLAVGHTISPNLVLFGELFDDIAVGPKIELNGEEIGEADDDVSAGVIGLGIGLAYYFPSNFYV